MRQKITERTLTRKAPGEIWDEYLPGFGLRIGKKRKTFFIMTRINGRQRRITVGNAAVLSLADARDRARDIMRNAAKGIDPQEAEKIMQREAARARRDTFACVADDYMTELGQHLQSASELQRKLDMDILPALGDIPVAEVRRADVKALFLDKAETKPVAANRMLALIRVILNYAIDEELIEANPAARIKARPEIPRDRYLSEVEIRNFWNGLSETGTGPQIKRILKLLLVTGQRRAEVCGMRWAEIDMQKAIWELPADRTKAGRAHRVPLSPLALDLIAEPHGGEHVFANGGGRPFHPVSVSWAMHREREALGLAQRATVHDLRRTMATHLGDLGIDRLIIGKLLNHSEQGVTGRVYDLGAYAEQKRLAMAAWSNKIMEIVSGEAAPSNVARLKRA
jgi:integrase